MREFIDFKIASATVSDTRATHSAFVLYNNAVLLYIRDKKKKKRNKKTFLMKNWKTEKKKYWKQAPLYIMMKIEYIASARNFGRKICFNVCASL